jgi:hypothetical protein
MLKRLVKVAVAALVLGGGILACSSSTQETPKVTVHDGVRDSLLPALCTRQSQCAPMVFATMYTSVADCVTTVLGQLVSVGAAGPQASQCDTTGWNQCNADVAASACPTSSIDQGVPDPPPSCKMCNK